MLFGRRVRGLTLASAPEDQPALFDPSVLQLWPTASGWVVCRADVFDRKRPCRVDLNHTVASRKGKMVHVGRKINETTWTKLLGFDFVQLVSHAEVELAQGRGRRRPAALDRRARATAETAPTQRDRHLQLIAEKGRMGWQKASGYNARARAEATVAGSSR